jgi:small multidrug resistance pump
MRLPVSVSNSLRQYRIWFYAAAIYNLAWGSLVILFPRLLFELLRIAPPNYLPLWQVVGMFVLVYAPAYFWAARYPDRFPQLIVIGLLGKLAGPIGFVYAAITRQLPLVFGLTILTNDLLWWPAFALYVCDAARLRGGWTRLLAGE